MCNWSYFILFNIQTCGLHFQMDRQKYAETIQKLDEALNILEEQVDEQRKQNDKLMAAEIKSRKQHEAFTLEKVEDLQEKLSLGITTLQQAIGGVTTQFEKEIKQVSSVFIARLGFKTENVVSLLCPLGLPNTGTLYANI